MPWRVWLALVVILGGDCAVAEPPIPAKDGIQYILPRGDFVIASTKDGLYRASLSDKVWHKIVTPADMPADGYLTEQDATSPRLAYYTDTGFESWRMSPFITKGSLYLSPDNGVTWKKVMDGNVLHVFLHPDGAIYVATEELSKVPFPPGGDSISIGAPDGTQLYPHEHLRMSRDDGKTWRDITPPARATFGISGIFRDPDHPTLVCVRSNQMQGVTSFGHDDLRTFIDQAVDENFHWSETSLEKWHGGRMVPVVHWPPIGHHTLYATLGNYFAFPFPPTGSNLALPRETLVTDKPAYRFRLNEFMFVTVTTKFLVPDPPIQLTDMKDETAFWSLRLRDPDGRIVIVGGRSGELGVIGDPDQAAHRAKYANDPYLIRQQVDQGHPYQRPVNLQKLYKFSKPGKYLAELIYDDSAFDQQAGVDFGTAGFEVEIMP